jgi:hypothetical protein
VRTRRRRLVQLFPPFPQFIPAGLGEPYSAYSLGGGFSEGTIVGSSKSARPEQKIKLPKFQQFIREPQQRARFPSQFAGSAHCSIRSEFHSHVAMLKID